MEKHELRKLLMLMWLVALLVCLVHNFDYTSELVDLTTAVLLIFCLLFIHVIRMMIDMNGLRVGKVTNIMLRTLEAVLIAIPVFSYITGMDDVYDGIEPDKRVIVGTANTLILLSVELVLVIIQDNLHE